MQKTHSPFRPKTQKQKHCMMIKQIQLNSLKKPTFSACLLFNNHFFDLLWKNPSKTGGNQRYVFSTQRKQWLPRNLGVVDEGIVHQTTVILPSTILLGHRFLRSRLSLKKTPRDMIKKTKVTTWVFPKILGFTPKSSILVGFSIINRPFWGIPIFGNTHMLLMDKILHHQG